MFTLKHKPLVLINIFIAIALIAYTLLFITPLASAAFSEDCPDGQNVTFNPPHSTYAEKCKYHQYGTSQSDDTEFPPGCPGNPNPGTPDPSVTCPPIETQFQRDQEVRLRGDLEGDCKDTNITKENCGIIAYLVLFIRVLSGLVGIVVVIMITIGGIQYASSRDNPQAVVAARGRIMNAVIALVLYLFAFAFLQYIVPGGVI